MAQSSLQGWEVKQLSGETAAGTENWNLLVLVKALNERLKRRRLNASCHLPIFNGSSLSQVNTQGLKGSSLNHVGPLALWTVLWKLMKLVRGIGPRTKAIEACVSLANKQTENHIFTYFYYTLCFHLRRNLFNRFFFTVKQKYSWVLRKIAMTRLSRRPVRLYRDTCYCRTLQVKTLVRVAAHLVKIKALAVFCFDHYTFPRCFPRHS